MSSGRRNDETVKNFLARRRKELKTLSRKDAQSPMDSDILVDKYEKAIECKFHCKLDTGLIFDERMALHLCPWDSKHPESPARYHTIMQRCFELNLLTRCVCLEYEKLSFADLTAVHSKSTLLSLKRFSQAADPNIRTTAATRHDSVFLNKFTFDMACLSAACTKTLVKQICLNKIKNGMAIVRPPGHHAMRDAFSGYCFINNVAIAAKYALRKKLADRILIVDIDVHHGQGTQRIFYESKQVLYFSIHRYEHGTFWPNLRESDVDYVGSNGAEGYNINFPLNETGITDDDYLSIIHQILMPVAYEFDPQLIIISAGFDAMIGDEKGEMRLTPGFYGHLITLLSGLASAKIAVVLEGGYFLPSLAEGVAMTVKALLGDPPAFLSPMTKPKESILRVISDLKYFLQDHWRCFKPFRVESLSEGTLHYDGIPETYPYDITGYYPHHSLNKQLDFTLLINTLKIDYENLGMNHLVVYSYDEDTLLHECNEDKNHVERPERLQAIYQLFTDWGLHNRCSKVDARNVELDEALVVHTNDYLSLLFNNQFPVEKGSGDVYYNNKSLKSILKASGGLLSVVDAVMSGEAAKGIALIRPPGHHAEPNQARGFCHLNNVGIAAQYILDKYKKKRILIVDFDIHHGNGTQKMFYNSKKVLYISIHRFDHGMFYPRSRDGSHEMCGEGDGLGFNVNIPLNVRTAGNSDYYAIFHKLILPIAYAYAPEVMMISAGFDAGINDPLGRYQLTPDAFSQFVQMLMPLASGKMILALEGGYNIQTLKYSVSLCAKTLLGDPLPRLDPATNLSPLFVKDLNNVIATQRAHWPVLFANAYMEKRNRKYARRPTKKKN